MSSERVNLFFVLLNVKRITEDCVVEKSCVNVGDEVTLEDKLEFVSQNVKQVRNLLVLDKLSEINVLLKDACRSSLEDAFFDTKRVINNKFVARLGAVTSAGNLMNLVQSRAFFLDIGFCPVDTNCLLHGNLVWISSVIEHCAEIVYDVKQSFVINSIITHVLLLDKSIDNVNDAVDDVIALEHLSDEFEHDACFAHQQER